MLDEIDNHILGFLRENGRASFAALGEHVGLSPHGAGDRVRRMQRDGVISGFTAVIDQRSVGRALDAFIDVRLMPSTDPDEFERLTLELPAVREIAFLTGRFDYLIRVACRDPDELDHTVRTIRRPGGAAQTETRIVMRSKAVGH